MNLAESNRTAAPSWQQAGLPHVWMPYAPVDSAPIPLAVTATDGVQLSLADGRVLLDGISSWWCACHGYNQQHIQRAVAVQLATMPHVMFGGLQHEPAMTLAARLAHLLPGSLNHVFFSDSGSVAIEVAMKMAVQYWRNQEFEGRSRFVSFRDAYHGDTSGAMSICDPVDSMHACFKGFLLEQFPHRIPRSVTEKDELVRFIDARKEHIAGAVIEPLVQCAGGMKFHSPQSLRWIADACRETGILLVADEVATGFGRTGSMFACSQAEVIPDIICLGKALTGGTLGLAATVASDKVHDAFRSVDPHAMLMHGPTFMANPLACAAANASLDLFESKPRLEEVKHIETQLITQLEPCRELPGVADVRCRGAIGVVELAAPFDTSEFQKCFVERGIWLRPLANVIYAMPPFVISDEQLTRLCATIVDVVRDWSCRLPAES